MLFEPSKAHVIHCGVLPAINSHRDSLSDFTDSKLVLSVGRLTEKKGHRYLIEAAAILKKKGETDIRWTIVGGGEDYDYLIHLARELGVSDIVNFTGPLTNEQVHELYAQASVMVLPCVRARNGDMDGIPVALMEAMAHKVPVISTYIAGIPELIRDGESGILLAPHDPIAIADAVGTLLSDRKLAERLANHGVKIIHPLFNVILNAVQPFIVVR